ncbi:hypothetical protein J6590_100355 [Homalodisca vitripennis]|nr:hypothetical protein J6590_100355 [Homalodisca vitripennis]
MTCRHFSSAGPPTLSVLRAGHTSAGGADANPLGPLHPAGGGFSLGNAPKGVANPHPWMEDLHPGPACLVFPSTPNRPLAAADRWRAGGGFSLSSMRGRESGETWKATSSRLAPYEGSPGLGLVPWSAGIAIQCLNQRIVIKGAGRDIGNGALYPSSPGPDVISFNRVGNSRTTRARKWQQKSPTFLSNNHFLTRDRSGWHQDSYYRLLRQSKLTSALFCYTFSECSSSSTPHKQ